MDVEDFLNQLNDLLKRFGLETAFLEGVEPQVGDTLRAMVPMSTEGDEVLLEIMVAPWTDDVMMLQFYTTLLTNVESGFDALQKALLDWNLTCPIGAFGIYFEKWHLYHKYNYPMPLEIDPAEMALEAFYILNLILDTIYVIYPQTIKLIPAA